MKTLLIAAILTVAGTVAFATNQVVTNNPKHQQQEQVAADTVAQPDTIAQPDSVAVQPVA